MPDGIFHAAHDQERFVALFISHSTRMMNILGLEPRLNDLEMRLLKLAHQEWVEESINLWMNSQEDDKKPAQFYFHLFSLLGISLIESDLRMSSGDAPVSIHNVDLSSRGLARLRTSCMKNPAAFNSIIVASEFCSYFYDRLIRKAPAQFRPFIRRPEILIAELKRIEDGVADRDSIGRAIQSTASIPSASQFRYSV